MLEVLRLQSDINDEDEGGRRRVRLGETILHSGEVRHEFRRSTLKIVVSLWERIALKAKWTHPKLSRNINRAKKREKEIVN